MTVSHSFLVTIVCAPLKYLHHDFHRCCCVLASLEPVRMAPQMPYHRVSHWVVLQILLCIQIYYSICAKGCLLCNVPYFSTISRSQKVHLRFGQSIEEI